MSNVNLIGYRNEIGSHLMIYLEEYGCGVFRYESCKPCENMMDVYF